MRYRYLTADVFTDRVFTGNPLAVFPNAAGLSTEQMQRIANEFNLSETVFVLPPERSSDASHRLRIFTPKRELVFAGHPTIGAAIVLATIGDIVMPEAETRIIFEEGVGNVPVLIRKTDSDPGFAQLTAAQPPEFGPPLPPRAHLAQMLTLDVADITHDDALPPQAVSVGFPFIMIPINTTEAVSRVRLNLAVFDELFRDFWANTVYIFGPAAPTSDADYRVRLFAPEMGIAEDPATGSAAAAFAGYLATHNDTTDGTLRWALEQGIEIERPSRLYIEADVNGGVVAAIRCGGHAVLVSEGAIEVPLFPQ